MNTSIQLTGENLTLRSICLSDVTESYVSWLNDPDVTLFMETRFKPQTKRDIETYVMEMIKNKNTYFFSIIHSRSKMHIGNIKLQCHLHHYHKNAEISLFIGEKKFWGKGLGFEAISLVRDFAFENLKLHKLKAGCYANNLRSIKSFEKAGFNIECTLKKECRYKGKFIDMHWLTIFSPQSANFE